MQLNRFVSQSGVCSRRAAVELIIRGEVKVNGATMANPAYRVQEADQVSYRGTVIRPVMRTLYVLLNKPLGVVTSCSDEAGRPTVLDCCPQLSKKVRLFPVGRLDTDSRGLILLTNDGSLAHKLTHPRFGIEKRYHVRLDKPISQEFVAQIRAGVWLNDGLVTVDYFFVNRDLQSCEIVIHSGRNRVIRRLMAAGGYHVIDLMRVRLGPIVSKGLPTGAWRYLTSAEVHQLERMMERGS